MSALFFLVARSGAAPADPITAAKGHWAFKAVEQPAVPKVRNEAWVRSPIDRFILNRLESENMAPAKRADKRTLIRRVTYDLTGLPPSPKEVANFLEDTSEQAFARVVDRLLGSPHYGERWARYWLDVARYADTKGYVFQEERRFPYSYTYRDYVLRAFNEDVPFDRFILEQIAADQLPLGEDKRPLAALGFLTLGRRFLNNQADIIDDRIDVVTRGLMGLTVGCARCHDHKYDPIPSADYYSLYGVFANSTEPTEKPLLGGDPMPFEYEDYIAERKKRSIELEDFRETSENATRATVRKKSGEYLLAAYDAFQLTDQSKAEAMVRERKLHPGTAQRWMAKLEQWRKEPNHPVFGPWFAFSELSSETFEEEASHLVLRWTTGAALRREQWNPMIALAVSGKPPASMKEVCERYGHVLAEVDARWNATLETYDRLSQKKKSHTPSPAAFTNPQLEELRQVLYASDSPAVVPDNEIRRLFDVPISQKLRALQRKLDELEATHPGAPPRAMALVDKESISVQRVFLRGNPRTPGPEVPRQFPRILAGKNRKPFAKGSGRLELAQAIASPNNPLTARVFVNRVWLHYFGAGLVRTPSDFGVRCDPPVHENLLDYLAWKFVNDGWSVKNLHRRILLSSTYQQSSVNDLKYSQIDPNNDFLWRMNRRRLDFESFRDSLIAVAGKLDLNLGGRAVDLTASPFTNRRTLYGFVERQNLPNLFRTFDFASPDTTNPQRFSTTVPQQALFMINSPFAVQQAKRFASRPELNEADSDEERFARMCQLAYQRDPGPEETQAALQFLTAQKESGGRTNSKDSLNPWEKLAQVLLMANEFAFVD